MEETKFLVQVGRGSKGAYRTRYALTNQGQATFYYNCINIGNGYKKRLIRVDGRPGHAEQIIARSAS